MFIGDVLQAFDNVDPLLMSRTMSEAGAHPHLNAAILEETDNLCAEVKFENLTEHSLQQNAPMIQGGSTIFRDLVIALICTSLSRQRLQSVYLRPK